MLELPFEYGRYRRLRRLIFDGLTGWILDAGVGTGRNIEFYPSGAEVIGIDVSRAMLARAERRRRLSPASTVELREMNATRLNFPAGAFDAAVATFLFCVLPDKPQLPALAELRRVVRPGGTVRLLDYVRPRRFLRSAVAKLWEPWIAWAYGASFDRNIEEYIPEAGLQLAKAELVVNDRVKLVTARAPGYAERIAFEDWRFESRVPSRQVPRRRLKSSVKRGVLMAQAVGAESRGEPVALAALFVSFLKVSLLGFGGGLVWARRIVVEQKRWVDDHEFAEILTLCQFMPGPNIVGITTCVGSRLRGPFGSIAAVAGFILIPWIIGLSLGGLYLQFAHLAVLRNTLGGLSAAAAGLMIATGIRLLMAHRSRRTALLTSALAFTGMTVVKLPLLVVLLGLAPLSIALAGVASKRAS